MPSRAAHRAALRRSKEPSVIPPVELAELPALPGGASWRNPVRGDAYVRSEWDAYVIQPHASVTLVEVERLADGSFAISTRGRVIPSEEERAQLQEASAAFELAVDWVRAKLKQ